MKSQLFKHIIAVMAVIIGAGLTAAVVYAQVEPEADVMPGLLDRLSWGAIIAGTLITLMVMFLLNLAGIAIGLSQINPEYDRDGDNTKAVATGGVVWVGVSNLVALFIGGWLAAYFAGIPEPVDGLLHGLMVWAVSGIITILLVMSGMGRVLSGMAGLIGSGLQLTGSLASGAGQVAGGALQTAGSAASTAGNMTAQTLSVLASGVQNSAQMIGSGISNLSDGAIENSPEVQNALKYQDLSLDEIRAEVEQLMRESGKDPRRVENQVRASVNDVATAAKAAVRDPEHADRILDVALQRVFRRGESMASDIDRDALVNLLAERTEMSHEEASQQIQRWEQQYNQVRQQTDEVRQTARQKAEEFRQQAEQKANEIYEQAQHRVTEMQQEAEARMQEAAREAEEKAREAAQEASDMFAKVAAGIAVAMLVGAIAAGLGGYIGAPEALPEATIETASTLLMGLLH